VYPWTAVLDYHIAFMQAHALDFCFNPSLWTKSDPHLHTMHLLTPFIIPPAATALSSSVCASLLQGDVGRMVSQVCYFWNDDSWGSPDAGCYHHHVCHHCKVISHTWKSCTNHSALAVAVPPAT
jgi:hypothetical protein